MRLHRASILAGFVLSLAGSSAVFAQGAAYDGFDKKPGLTILDACYLIHEILGPAPSPEADVNGDGAANVTDVVALLMQVTPKGKGDFNGDGETNVVDRQVQLLQVFSPNPDLICDLNEDGDVDVADLQMWTLIWLTLQQGCVIP